MMELGKVNAVQNVVDIELDLDEVFVPVATEVVSEEKVTAWT